MRIAVWALATLAGTACVRRSLQEDAGGGAGSIGLDAAGDVRAIDGGPGPIDALHPRLDAGVAGPDANCGVSTVRGRFLPMDMLVVLDRSVPEDQTTWRDVLQALVGQISATDWNNWGLQVFPKEGPACGASTVTAGADLPVMSGAAFHLTAHIAAAGGTGNGTPTAAAISAGASYLRTLVDDNTRSMLLVTDGAPTCAGKSGALSDDAVMAQLDAMTAIASARAEGFRTIVVAPSTTADVSALNALAQAGGYARQGDVQFFTESTFREWFAGPELRACRFSLASQPPVPTDLTVILNGVVVPRDPSRVNGWEYTTQPYSAVELHGAWCDRVTGSQTYEVTVYFGCAPLLDSRP
jgi:hypothetical protein